MANDENASLREFAGIIQEKAGPVSNESRPEQSNEPGQNLVTPLGSDDLQSVLSRQPRMVVAGIAAGIGVAVGYLLGKLARK